MILSRKELLEIKIKTFIGVLNVLIDVHLICLSLVNHCLSNSTYQRELWNPAELTLETQQSRLWKPSRVDSGNPAESTLEPSRVDSGTQQSRLW